MLNYREKPATGENTCVKAGSSSSGRTERPPGSFKTAFQASEVTASGVDTALVF